MKNIYIMINETMINDNEVTFFCICLGPYFHSVYSVCSALFSRRW